MNSILINPKDQKEFKAVQELLFKLGVNSKIFTEEEKEDLGLSLLLKEANRKEIVSEDEVLKKLLR